MNRIVIASCRHGEDQLTIAYRRRTAYRRAHLPHCRIQTSPGEFIRYRRSARYRRIGIAGRPTALCVKPLAVAMALTVVEALMVNGAE